MPRKRTYHTDLLFRFQLGILPDHIRSHVPSSTLSGWKRRDLSKIIGADHAITAENLQLMRDYLARKHLLAAAKTLWHIYRLISSILSGVRGVNKILRSHRAEIVDAISRASDTIGLRRAAAWSGISVSRYYSWKNRHGCTRSPLHLCRKRQPHQLATKETAAIKHYFTLPQYLHWSAASVYYQMMRDNIAAMSLGTFYKYVNLMQLSRSVLRKSDVKIFTPLRATHPFKILHQDITIFRPTDHTRVYIYIIQDSYSRAILAARASLEYSSHIAKQNLREACEKFSLWNTPIQLITDGGSENKGEVLEFLSREDVNIEKLIAQVDIVQSNSMIEAANKRLKYDFLYANPPPDYSSTVTFLEKAVEIYNNKPLHVLHGLTPNEVLQGKVPDRTWLKEKVAKASQERLTHNKDESCQICK